ncbi:MAG: hypothetical protein V4718_04475 [Pseudomonadota bacterium]
MTFVVLATGPSMTHALADSIRGRCKVVAVSDAYKLAPWADALASTDAKWWKAHPDAQYFEGLKFTAAPDFVPVPGAERLAVDTHTNSGLLGLMVAVKMGAKRILMCGFDLSGSHFFGPHLTPLRNTSPQRFEQFKKQFAAYQPRGVEIINCTPDSGLHCYPKKELNACLDEPAIR